MRFFISSFALLDRVMQSQIFTSYALKPTLYLCPGTSLNKEQP